jgi:hypothetical protein
MEVMCMSDDIFGDIGGMFRRMDDRHDKLRGEFERLACEPCTKPVGVGDRVLVHAGLCLRGHDWIRLEAEVLAVADTSYKVNFVERTRVVTGEPDIEWIHRFLVTDVISSTPNQERNDE